MERPWHRVRPRWAVRRPRAGLCRCRCRRGRAPRRAASRCRAPPRRWAHKSGVKSQFSTLGYLDTQGSRHNGRIVLRAQPRRRVQGLIAETRPLSFGRFSRTKMKSVGTMLPTRIVGLQNLPVSGVDSYRFTNRRNPKDLPTLASCASLV
jgi:hypothetical protein